MDLDMPVMDGWAFRELQLQDLEIAAIPVIVVTAAVDAHHKGSLGAIDILSKPADPAILLARVEKSCLRTKSE
jgi:CheY-like chemotaxis protein